MAARKKTEISDSVGWVYRFGAPAPGVRSACVPTAAPAVSSPAPVHKPWVKVKLQADSLFGFDQDSLQADGKQALDKLLQELKDVNVEAVQVTGHTDRLGSAAYNAKLSTRRAEAVRNYLVQVGACPPTWSRPRVLALPNQKPQRTSARA
jgi:OOP family OmpA-OmpF porin